MPVTAPAKDPRKQRAGKIGALTRWGTAPRTVNLGDLTDSQRRLVIALVEAARKEAVPASERPGTAESEGTSDAAPTT